MGYTPEQVEEYLSHVKEKAGSKYTPEQIEEYSKAVRKKQYEENPDLLPSTADIGLDPTQAQGTPVTTGQRAAGAAALLGAGATAIGGATAGGLAYKAAEAGAKAMGLGAAYGIGTAITRRLGKLFEASK